VLLAIDAIDQYQASRSSDEPSLRLWVAGTGDDEKRVRQYVDSKQLEFVEFLGHLTGSAKWNALEAAHIFLFPTCYPEGMSIGPRGDIHASA
jgi:glycosyltransferase involved in cell wall biosynthesis